MFMGQVTFQPAEETVAGEFQAEALELTLKSYITPVLVDILLFPFLYSLLLLLFGPEAELMRCNYPVAKLQTQTSAPSSDGEMQMKKKHCVLPFSRM